MLTKYILLFLVRVFISWLRLIILFMMHNIIERLISSADGSFCIYLKVNEYFHKIFDVFIQFSKLIQQILTPTHCSYHKSIRNKSKLE